MRKIVLLGCLTLSVFAAEIESLRPVNLVANDFPSNTLTGVLFGQKIQINKSDFNSITIEEGFCDTGKYGYRSVILNDRITKKLVYDSCAEKEFYVDKGEKLKEYPLAVFPDKIEKVNLDTNNPFLPKDPDTIDNSDPFKNEVVPIEPTEPTTPTNPLTPTEPTVDNGNGGSETTPTEPTTPTIPKTPEYVYNYIPVEFSGITKKNDLPISSPYLQRVSFEQYTDNMKKIFIDNIYKHYEIRFGVEEGRKKADSLLTELKEQFLTTSYDYYDFSTQSVIYKNVYKTKLININILTETEMYNTYTKYEINSYLKTGFAGMTLEIKRGECNGPCSSVSEIVPFYSEEAYNSFMNDFYNVRTTIVEDNFAFNFDKIRFSMNICLYYKENGSNKQKCFNESKQTDSVNENLVKVLNKTYVNQGNSGFFERETRFKMGAEKVAKMQKKYATVSDWKENNETIEEVTNILFYHKSLSGTSYPNGYIKISYKPKQIRDGVVTAQAGTTDTYAPTSDNIEAKQILEDLAASIKLVP